MPTTAVTKPEKLMVCVGPSPAGAALIRAVGEMAAGTETEWFAVYVENARMLNLPEAERLRAVENLRLAEQLDGASVTLRGRSIGEELANFARRRGITRIVIGRPGSSRGGGVGWPPARWMNWCGSARISTSWFRGELRPRRGPRRCRCGLRGCAYRITRRVSST